MTDWIKKALTKTIVQKNHKGKQQIITIPPNERLVITVKFAITMIPFLVTLEIAHIALLHVWNAEIFAAITGLIGTITGILVSNNST